MGHQQPPTPVATYNTAANRIFNGKKKKILIHRHEILLGQRQKKTKLFHILWEEGKKNLADYFTKHHPIWHHRTMRPIYVKAKQKDIENSKDWQTGNGRGCVETTNPGGTRKPYNPLKGIRNQIPRNLANPRKGIWELASNEIRSQWPGGLTAPT